MDDAVHESLLEHEFRALEAGRKILADGLPDHARAGEAHQRPRLGEDHVAERGVGREHAGGGRVGEHRDERQPLVLKPRQQGRRLGHLHQREDSLLHAGAAGRGDDHQRPPLGDRQLDRARDLLSHHRPHAPAHEEEIHHGEARRLPADVGHSREGGVLHAGLALRVTQPVGVAHLGVAEFERVGGLEIGEALLEGARIDDELEVGAGRHAEMKSAARAGPQVLVEHRLEQRLPAALALGPQAFGHLGARLLPRLRLDAGTFAFEPGHD